MILTHLDYWQIHSRDFDIGDCTFFQIWIKVSESNTKTSIQSRIMNEKEEYICEYCKYNIRFSIKTSHFDFFFKF